MPSTPKPWDHAAGVLVLREPGGEGSVGGSNNSRAGSLDARSLVATIASAQSDVRKLLFTDQVRKRRSTDLVWADGFTDLVVGHDKNTGLVQAR